MTYLTRMQLNPSRVRTRRMLGSPQVAHALVEASARLPGAPSGRVLWRIDRESSHELFLYIVSPGKPDLTGVVEQAGWPTTPHWDAAPYDRLLGRIHDGDRWRFRITANPTRVESTSAMTRGRVKPLRTVTEQEGWLIDRGQRHGFAIPSNSMDAVELAVTGREERTFVRHTGDADSGSSRVPLTRATFEGILEVTDHERLVSALTDGIGRARGYGCGLMTLASL